MRLFSCRQINRDGSSAVDQLDHQLSWVPSPSAARCTRSALLYLGSIFTCLPAPVGVTVDAQLRQLPVLR